MLHLEQDLTISKIDTQSVYAGRLGRRIEQTIHAKASDGREVTIKVSPYHTRFGEPKKTFKVGDKI
jgi:hypothetical protein